MCAEGRAACKAATQVVEAAPSILSGTPLEKSIPMLKAWVGAATEFIEAACLELVTSAARALGKQSSLVDSLCPRWGECVSGSVLLDDAAKVALLYDTKLQTLPQDCRALHQALATTSEVATRLEIPGGVEDAPITKEYVRGGKSSLWFGKQTVNVSAAVRLLFTQPPKPHRNFFDARLQGNSSAGPRSAPRELDRRRHEHRPRTARGSIDAQHERAET